MKTGDIAALVFELQRSRSPVERARVLARAWRTVRDLSPTERRMLAREVGFDGAEELLEGLAGKGAGGIAPAALLEALGRVRKDDGLSVRGLVSALRDPAQREQLLVRAADLVADTVSRTVEPEDDPVTVPDQAPAAPVPTPPPPPKSPRRSAESVTDGAPSSTPSGPAKVKVRARPAAPPPAVPKRPIPRPAPPAQLPAPEGRGDEAPAPSVWDAIGVAPAREPVAPLGPAETFSAAPGEVGVAERGEDRRPASALHRLRELRSRIESLRHAAIDELEEALDTFPEPWARRKGLVAMLENGVPEDVSTALDLVETLGRTTDRGWCLATLARRGGLAGEDLERALAMLVSPAARRRVAALARSALA